MHKLFADSTPSDLFGTVAPPGPKIINTGNPIEALGHLLAIGINLVLTLAAITLLLYLLWGAYDWIVSSGEADKLKKAQDKIVQALMGFFVLVIVISVFGFVAGDILGIVKRTSDGGWTINIPTFNGIATPTPETCPHPDGTPC